MLGGAPLAAAAPGDLDPTFSGDGRVSLAAAGSFVARAVALQDDGRIVVAGASCDPDPATGDATCLREGASSFRIARLTRVYGGPSPRWRAISRNAAETPMYAAASLVDSHTCAPASRRPRNN